MKDKTSLVRVVLSGGEIAIDATSKAPGRGAYVCPGADCLEKAHKMRGFERSFKRAVPHEIPLKLSEFISER